jgi:hypothetical protein
MYVLYIVVCPFVLLYFFFFAIVVSVLLRVNLVTNQVISREWGKDREVVTTSGTYPWSFVTQIFHSGQPSHDGDRPPWHGWLLWNICVTNDHGYVPLVASNSRSFPRSWLIPGFLTRLTRRVSLVEQELLTLPEHLSSPPGFLSLDLSFVRRTPLKTGGELRCSGRLSSSCSISDTRCVNIFTNQVISREWGKDREAVRTLLNQGFLFVKLKSSLRMFYGRHHDMVDCYGIFVSQMTTDMFHLS